MMNDAADVTNLFYKDNDDMRRKACDQGYHCLDRAPLFAQLGQCLLVICKSCTRNIMEDNHNRNIYWPQVCIEFVESTSISLVH